MAPRTLLRLAIAAALWAAGDVAAWAQSSGPADTAAPATDIHPPEPIDTVAAEYPADALRARIEATVVLRLTIDADGAVTEAEVIEPAGHGFDESARAAALRVRYRPARRGDVKVPSRILTRVEFRLPEEPPAPPPPETPLDVTVRGASAAERRRQSAEAVTVVETERARRQSADMGEVIARTQGVGVRRAGGLGSGTRFSLNGLTDDQVRFFLDGVPLELSGYPFGIANVPVNLVDRIEIHGGVVPIRLGADALGGAVELVTDRDLRGTHASASYEVGSFDTHRLTLAARHQHEPTGLFARVTGFFDYAKNDYPIDVEVADEHGQLSAARVHRFHDGYRAAGGNAELGVADRPWARRLVLRVFASEHDKDYQHNVVMTVPYGGVSYGQTATGATLRYEHDLGRGVSLDALAGYSYTRGRFIDEATCVYDWFGRCVNERSQPGETDGRPHDQLSWDHAGFARANLAWRVHPQHALRLAVAPAYLTRTGDERRQADPMTRDPLTADRRLLTIVSGVEHEADLVDDRLENLLFAKHYMQRLHSEEPRPAGMFRRHDRATQRVGIGDGLRYRVAPWLMAKASYEWATRLPRPDEVFGDGRFLTANLELAPETSHNANLGASVDLRDPRSGAWRGVVNGFLREADQLIVLIGNDRAQSYQNVYGARALGVECAVGWTSPGERIALDANVTYQDVRNTARAGTFGGFAGDRLPNRPYLFANGAARLPLRGVVAPGDELALSWNTRYVHDYFRGWESVGLTATKQVIPTQLVHGIALGYLVRRDSTSLSTSVELHNLTDEPVFDFFGVQRPGRAFYVKTTAEF